MAQYLIPLPAFPYLWVVMCTHVASASDSWYLRSRSRFPTLHHFSSLFFHIERRAPSQAIAWTCPFQVFLLPDMSPAWMLEIMQLPSLLY
ncbi:hypothetical protein BKA64DRAFT_687995 [Cadophora sp. MPI-SDFR-AT-0126]|nr:hypothetical protein BKA64DRAFT_687995 [Leotiomycetes sp. MPI-SDFR-AT-0126]